MRRRWGRPRRWDREYWIGRRIRRRAYAWQGHPDTIEEREGCCPEEGGKRAQGIHQVRNWRDEPLQRHLSCMQEQNHRCSAGQGRPAALVRERRVGERNWQVGAQPSSKDGAWAVPLLAIFSLDRILLVCETVVPRDPFLFVFS